MTDAFPKRFPDRYEVARVRGEAEALEVGAEGPETRRLAGRVMARRDMGKLVFLDLVDRSGRIQLLCPAARTGEVDVHLGDVIGVVFPCGWVLDEKSRDLRVYYGAADTSIALATANLDQVLDYLRTCPSSTPTRPFQLPR